MKNLNRNFSRKIRIIGGKWKNRKLLVLNKTELRPTTDRFRETLFNWLSPFITNTRCLDCFSGTGILGLEALSRKASSVTLLEVKRDIVKQLKKNLTRLKISGVKVINVNTFTYLNQTGIPYDIIFVDPPFRKNFIEKTVILLEKNGWLARNTFLYIESEMDNTQLYIPSYWTLYRETNSLTVKYRLYQIQKK